MRQGAKGRSPKKSGVSESDRAFAQRLYDAFKAYNAAAPRDQEITQKALGERVARRLKRSEPFGQSAVSAWMSVKDPSIPDELPVIEAIADELRMDPAWLAWGRGGE